MSDAPPRTHNLPSLAEMLPKDTVDAIIEAAVEPLRKRAAELVTKCETFLAAHADIKTPADLTVATDVLTEVQDFVSGSSGRVERKRIELRDPAKAVVDAVGSLANGPFAKVLAIVQPAFQRVNQVVLAYNKKVDAERKAEAARVAQEAADEAAFKTRMAERGRGGISMADAAEAEATAQKLQQQVDARPAERTRSHGTDRGTVSMTYRREAVVTDAAAVPRQYCSPDIVLIRAASGKAGSTIPVIAGVRIEDVPENTIRR